MPRALAALLALLLACGPSAVRTDRVEMFDVPGRPQSEWGYRPAAIEVSQGTTVTFANGGIVFHTVTSDDAGRPFDVGADAGQTATVTFDRPGTFRYHCGVHPDMRGVVHVCDGACR